MNTITKHFYFTDNNYTDYPLVLVEATYASDKDLRVVMNDIWNTFSNYLCLHTSATVESLYLNEMNDEDLETYKWVVDNATFTETWEWNDKSEYTLKDHIEEIAKLQRELDKAFSNIKGATLSMPKEKVSGAELLDIYQNAETDGLYFSMDFEEIDENNEYYIDLEWQQGEDGNAYLMVIINDNKVLTDIMSDLLN